MESLGCTDPETLKEDYGNLAKKDFLAIWEKEQGKFSEAYAVCYADEAIENWDPVFKNGRFAVYQLP